MPEGKTLYVILSANASAYKAALNGASRDTREFGRDVDAAGRQLDAFSRNSDKAASEIDRMSGRVRLIVDALTLLGPAAVPIGAVALPAITGLAAQMVIAGAAAGTAVLAFQGVGEAMKAITKADLDPSAENLAEVHRTMSELAPAAREFVTELDSMMPALDTIQNAAAQGAFPGITDGLRDMQSSIPTVRRMVYDLASAFGDSAEGLADGFDSQRGREFMQFVAAEARPTLDTLLATVQNLAAGVGEMWQAFDPINDDFGTWLLEQSRAFDEWSQNLSGTDDFQEFLAYIRETGPQVAETLGALGGAGLDVIQALAPLGGPALQGIELFADAISVIADSPIGPTLFAAAAAATVFNRSLQGATALLGKMGVASAAGGPSAMFDAMGDKARGARSGVSGLARDLRTMRGEYSKMGAASAVAMSGLSNTTGAAQRVRSTLSSATRAAGGAAGAIGALAVVSTDAGQGLGVTNTAMLGLMGSMRGPGTAAIGVGVGFLLDWKAASGQAAEATRAFQSAVDNQFVSMTTYSGALSQLTADTSAFEKAAGVGPDMDWMSHITRALTPSGIQNNLDVLFGGVDSSEMARLAEATDKAKSETADLQLAAQLLARQMGVVGPEISNSAMTTEQLDAALVAAGPAMQALGYSTEDLIRAIQTGDFTRIQGEIEAYQARADSAAGRTEAFGQSVADLGNDALSTAQSAGTMSAALQAMLSPALNLEEATDAWRESLKTLRNEMKAAAGFKGFSAGAMENRSLSRDYMTTSMERLTRLAEVSTTTEKDMADAVAATRREFIRSGIAAGFSKREIVQRANAMGLTPKMIRTVFRAAGISESDLAARRYRAALEKVPKQVRTVVRQEGVPRTIGEVNRLVEKYKLTEKERRALVSLMDRASGPLRGINSWLDRIDGRSTSSRHTHTTSYQYQGSPPSSATFRPGLADGGTVPGQRSPYGDRTLILAAPGEEIITNRNGQADQFRADRAAGRIPRYAAGGKVGATPARLGAQLAGGDRGRRVIVVRPTLPDRMVLQVGDQQMTAYVRKQARDVVGQRVSYQDQADTTEDRMSGWR